MAVGPCKPWPRCLPIPARSCSLPRDGGTGPLALRPAPQVILSSTFFIFNFLCFYKLHISRNYWSWLLPMVPMIISDTKLKGNARIFNHIKCYAS